MKALTLWQPWASLVAIGAKLIETRSWTTRYRGELAIHAGGRWQWRDQLDLGADEPFKSALNAAGYHVVGQLPRGAIIAVVDLVLVGLISLREDGEWTVDGMPGIVAEDELAFGYIDRGRYGWLLKRVRRLRVPVLCSGAQGLWDLPDGVEARVRAALGPGHEEGRN